MLQRVFHNLIPARAKAALVALLYVFLCTFGMVTHTHTPGDMHASRATSSAVSVRLASHDPAHAHTQIGKRAASEPTHCAFCDWQANSQGRTVAAWNFVTLPSFVSVYMLCHAPPLRVLAVSSSSRAPPIA